MQTGIDNALQQAQFEMGGCGVVYGLSLAPTTPTSTMALAVARGVAYWDTFGSGVDAEETDPGSIRQSTRIVIPTNTSISLTVDHLGISTTPPSGQERWLSVVAIPSREASDPRTDGSGNPVNFVDAEAGSIIVVAGLAAAVGTAYRPSASTTGGLGVRLGDILINSGTTLISDPTSIRSEMRDQIRTVVHQQDGGNGNGPRYSLFWESMRDPDYVLRAYIVRKNSFGVPAGLCLTLNAQYDGLADKWTGIFGKKSTALRFTEAGLLFTQRTTTVTTPWADNTDGSWGDVPPTGSSLNALLGPNGLKLFDTVTSSLVTSTNFSASGGSNYAGAPDTVTVVVGCAGKSSSDGSSSSFRGTATFPRPFNVNGGTLVGSILSMNQAPVGDGYGIGPDYDANVNTTDSPPTLIVTPYGVMIDVLPATNNAGSMTYYSRFVTVTLTGTPA